MLLFILICVPLLLSPSLVSAQQVGTNQAEKHPPLMTYTCTKAGGCTPKQGSVVIDSNWRWTHNVGGYQNCYTGNTWDTKLCPDPVTCAKGCVLEGANYAATYGITTTGTELRLNFVTQSQGRNVGSRVYLMDTDTKYEMFDLLNKEFTFDVDVSNLPCGLNGALYFVEMAPDGGMKEHADNKCGAKYGTGYCDAQCPHDIKWINGEANVLNWKPSTKDPNSGAGKYGACCAEMDIWEANSISEAYTAHPCSKGGLYRCSGLECGDATDRYKGVCDKDGCDLNPFRAGVTGFYGPGKVIDTTKPFTVVTQFLAPNGVLTEIRRLFKQDGKVFQHPHATAHGLTDFDSLTDPFCREAKKLFGDLPDFFNKGGMSVFSSALKRGMVLVLSLWDDYEAHMLWLDSNYPLDKSPTQPGVARGTCPTDSGNPKDVESQYPNAYVKFSNVKFGEIDSTY